MSANTTESRTRSRPDVWKLHSEAVGAAKTARDMVRHKSNEVPLPDGDGDVVLAFNGFGTTSESMNRNRDVLRKHGYKAHTLTGFRNWGLTKHSLDAHEIFLVQKFQENGNNPVSILAYSLGGHMALHLLRQHPDKIKKIVFITSPIQEDLISAGECTNIAWAINLPMKLMPSRFPLEITSNWQTITEADLRAAEITSIVGAEDIITHAASCVALDLLDSPEGSPLAETHIVKTGHTMAIHNATVDALYLHALQNPLGTTLAPEIESQLMTVADIHEFQKKHPLVFVAQGVVGAIGEHARTRWDQTEAVRKSAGNWAGFVANAPSALLRRRTRVANFGNVLARKRFDQEVESLGLNDNFSRERDLDTDELWDEANGRHLQLVHSVTDELHDIGDKAMGSLVHLFDVAPTPVAGM